MRQAHIVDGVTPPAPLSVLGEAVTVLAAEDAAKPFEVHLQHGRRDGGPPPHRHPWDEAFYVLDGQVAFTIGDRSTMLGPGSYVHLPSGTIHAYRNVSDVATLLAIVSDCRGGRMFAAIDAESGTGPDAGARALDIGRRHGVEWFLPEQAE